MNTGNLPGPIYAISAGARPLDRNEYAVRLIHVHAEGKHCVALFTTEEGAKRWMEDNAPSDSSLQIVALADETEVVDFLTDLLSSGDTHVGFDPKGKGVGLVEIRALVQKLARVP